MHVQNARKAIKEAAFRGVGTTAIKLPWSVITVMDRECSQACFEAIGS